MLKAVQQIVDTKKHRFMPLNSNIFGKKMGIAYFDAKQQMNEPILAEFPSQPSPRFAALPAKRLSLEKMAAHCLPHDGE